MSAFRGSNDAFKTKALFSTNLSCLKCNLLYPVPAQSSILHNLCSLSRKERLCKLSQNVAIVFEQRKPNDSLPRVGYQGLLMTSFA